MSPASVTISSGSSLRPSPRMVAILEHRRVARPLASAKNITRSSCEHAGSREVTVTREEEQGADWRWQRCTSPHLPRPTRSTSFNMLLSTAGTSSIGRFVHASPDPAIERLLTEVLLEPDPVSLSGLPELLLVLPSLLLPSLRWEGAHSRASRSADEREDLSPSSSSFPCCLLRLLLLPPSTGGRTCCGKL